jgi:hypothetical protein
MLFAVAALGSSPATAADGLLNWAGKRVGLGKLTQPLDDLNREIITRSGENSEYAKLNGSFWPGGFRSAPNGPPPNQATCIEGDNSPFNNFVCGFQRR